MSEKIANKLSAENQPLVAKASVGGAYEGASRLSQELALWSPPVRSADADLKSEKATADARARDISRNEPFVNGAIHTHKDAIVGGQYALNATPVWQVLRRYNKGFDEVWAEEAQEVIEQQFGLWAESHANWPDASRTNNFTGLIRLGVGIFTVAGELLATAEWLRDSGRHYKTAIQMVDLDRLSNPVNRDDDEFLRQGVVRNKYGAPAGYYIRLAHPGDVRFNAFDTMKHKYVPATKDWGRQQVIHIIEQDRPEQTRGIAAMVSALKEMRMAKKYHEITLQNAVVNATYAAAIESELPPDAAFAAMGSDDAMGWIKTYLSSIGEYVGSSRNLHIDGVKIPHLFPGTKLKLMNAGQPGGVGTSFEESLHRKIAASLGMSYEEFAHDFSKTNYSSARAAMNGTHKRMQSRKKMVADRFASSIYTLWAEEALAKGDVPLPVGVKRDFFYQGHYKEAFCAAEWIGATRGQIDELKETEAAVLRIEKGLSSYEAEMSRLGTDWRKTFRQRAREEKMKKSLGLDFSQDKAQQQGKANANIQQSASD